MAPPESRSDGIPKNSPNPAHILHDPVLGELHWDKPTKWFVGQAIWMEHPVDINLITQSEEQGERVAQLMRTLWDRQTEWHAQLQAYAWKKILAKLDVVWSEREEKKAQAKLTANPLVPMMVCMNWEGNFELSFHADPILDHCITIDGNIDGRIKDIHFDG